LRVSREGSGERYYYVEVTNAVQVHYGRDNGVRVHYNKVVSKVFVVRLASNDNGPSIVLVVVLAALVVFMLAVVVILMVRGLRRRHNNGGNIGIVNYYDEKYNKV